MTELQERVLELLQEIDDICQANGIEWYLAAGSALGAVRHGGFIPWDDDADIYMTVENWKKFYAVRDQIPEGRILITPEEDFSCGYTINRYADLSSTRLYRYLCGSPQPSGLIVDILVLDRVPDNEEAVRDYVVNLTEYADILVRATSHSFRSPYPINDRENYKKLKKMGRDALLRELKARAEKYDGTEHGVLIQRDPTVPHVWKEEVFGKPQYIPFENTRMPVAAHPFLHLCGAFNEEWMYVPDNIDRQEHVKGVIMDISNNNPFDDYLAAVDNKDVDDAYTQLIMKDNLLGELRKKDEWDRLKMTAAKVKMVYRRLGISAGKLKEWLDAEEFETLDEYFSEYHTMQASKAMIGGVAINGWLRSQQPFYIDLGDDFLYYYLRNLMRGPQLSRADRILKGREALRPLDTQLKELRGLIVTIRSICCDMEEKNYRKALEETEVLRELYPENLALLHLYLGARALTADTPEDKEALKEFCLDLPEYQAEDPVASCILADQMLEEGKEEEAAALYRWIVEMSNHGLVLAHICDAAEPRRETYVWDSLWRAARVRLGNLDDAEILEEEDEEDEEEGEGQIQTAGEEEQDG